MKNSSAFDYRRIPEGVKFNTRLMVSLTADTNTKEIGKPLNVAVVLDRSGSMNGEPLHYVKMATKVLANQLNPDDRFSLTMYDSSVDILIKPTLMKDIRSLDAVIDTINRLNQPTPDGEWFSTAVPSDGSYGIPKGLIFSFPLRSSGGASYEIVQGVELNEFGQQQLQSTREELEMEREAVQDLMS